LRRTPRPDPNAARHHDILFRPVASGDDVELDRQRDVTVFQTSLEVNAATLDDVEP
jgi:hypothetical protein